MQRLAEILDTRRWAQGQGGPEPEPEIRRTAPPAPPEDTFEDELQASLAITTHYSRFSKQGLPDPSSPEGVAEYGLWLKKLIARGVRTSDFLAASEEIKVMKDVYPGDHLRLILDLTSQLEQARRDRAAMRARRESGQESQEERRDLLTLWEALTPQTRSDLRERAIQENPFVRDFSGRARDIWILVYCFELMASESPEPPGTQER